MRLLKVSLISYSDVSTPDDFKAERTFSLVLSATRDERFITRDIVATDIPVIFESSEYVGPFPLAISIPL